MPKNDNFFSKFRRTPFEETVAARNKRYAQKGRLRVVDEQIIFVFFEISFQSFEKWQKLQKKYFFPQFCRTPFVITGTVRYKRFAQ